MVERHRYITIYNTINLIIMNIIVLLYIINYIINILNIIMNYYFSLLYYKLLVLFTKRENKYICNLQISKDIKEYHLDLFIFYLLLFYKCHIFLLIHFLFTFNFFQSFHKLYKCHIIYPLRNVGT